MIEVKKLSKSYGKTKALKDVSLEISSRKRTVILGPSGCGKTTLLRVLAGLETPDQGEVYFGEICVSRPGFVLAPHQRNIGMVFQDLALWPHMTVWQNIGFGLEKVIKQKGEREGRMIEMLNIIRLQNKTKALPGQLSGGEQQRVALARALVRQPKILLLDEPLTNLDQKLKRDLLDMILTLHKKYLMTLVYVTHDMHDAEAIAEEIVFMQEGKVVATDSFKHTLIDHRL